MKRPGDSPLTQLLPVARCERPGKVRALRGIIFQSDNSSYVGAVFIRPIETFDRWQAGLARGAHNAPLAMHAGLHVVLEDGREFVAEQLVGTLFEDFKNGLNWTPLESFRQRESTGWDVTVPATCFRGITDAVVGRAVDFLNAVEGHPFFGEDCVKFIERVFGGRRLFGDSPTGLALGLGLRVGDPALPLLRADAQLDPEATRLLRVSTVRAQSDPVAGPEAPNAHRWLGRLLVWAVGALAVEGVFWLFRARRR